MSAPRTRPARAQFEGHLWDEPPTAWERHRIRETVAAVPEGVRTIVDVGGGDGRVSRALAARGHDVLLLDGSQGALTRAPDLKRARCQIDRLPLPDASFDLVACCELLEHLPHPLLERTCDELVRISRRYVLITVPHNEDLRLMTVKCPRCRHTFHGYGHLHSFTPGRMRRLLPGNIELKVLHKPQPSWHPGLFWLRTRVLGRYAYYPHAHCPACGHDDFSRQATDWVRKGIGGLNHLLNRARPRPGGHLLALYDLHAEAPPARPHASPERDP